VGDVDLSIAAALVEMSKSGRAERLRVGAVAVFLRKPRETLRTGDSSMNATVPSISIYAALLALLAAALTVNVILNRVRSGVASGDGGVSGLARAIRAHANFTEQAPIALIAIACGEASGVRPFVVNILGVALIVARLTAAYALNRSIGQSPPRQFAGGLSILILVAAGIAALLATFGMR
jgi:uncharacterized membrane protein YecN with MAPEG domain